MHVGIVGAGMTGLATLHELRDRGVAATCFEASAEPGGVVRSRTVAGTVVEHGPQRVRQSGIVESYLERFDLADALLVADEATVYVYSEGRLREVPFDLPTLVRTDLVSERAKARLLYEPFTRPAGADETVAAYFRRKLGDEVYERVVEPLFGGLYASDPAAMPITYALDGLSRLERERGSLTRVALDRLGGGPSAPAAVPRGGMQALPRAIADRHEGSVRLDTPVEAIEPRNEGFRLQTADGTTEFERVVVATDAPAAADLLAASYPDLAEGLEGLRYNPLALVYLRAPIDRAGLGFQVGRREGLDLRGASWNGVAFGRDDLVTAFLGGMGDPDLVDADDDTLVDIAVDDLETATGVRAEGLAVHRVRPGMPAYDRSWRHRETLDPPSGLDLVGSYTARVGIPGRLRQGRRIAEAIAQA